MQSIYKEIITSKTGSLIPVLKSGKTLESSYNPEKDAERKIDSMDLSASIFLFTGLGSGILISKLLEIKPEAKVLCIEYSKTDINLLKNIPLVNSLIPKIILFTKEEITQNLIQNYIPALYGNLKIIEQTNYLSENSDYSDFLKKEIQKAVTEISKDYSVQAHFGKLWQHNILNNYKLLKVENPIHPKMPEIFKTKKCAILAAGPTLDEKISFLKEKKEDYFVLSTDTAYQAAQRHNLHCDAVVTLDAQNISTVHYSKNTENDTLYLLDFSSSPSISKKLLKHNCKILYFTTGHPLSKLLTEENKTLKLNSGSGTVTIAALDFALKADFPHIEVFGADFSYPGNKPYAKGTYLDTLYNCSSVKTFPSEQKYSKLMFRTELTESEGIKTTEILKSYRQSFEAYLKGLKIPFELKQNVYVIEKNYENINKEFLNNLLTKERIFEKINSENQNFRTALLPFAAFLQRTNPDLSPDELRKTAEADLRRYLAL